MSQKKITIRKLGAKLLGGHDAEQHASEILWQQNQLWNKLVELENSNTAQWRQALRNNHSEYDQLCTTCDQIDVQIQALITQRSQVRQRTRQKSNDAISALTAQIKVLSDQRNPLYEQLAKIKLAARQAAKADLDALELQRREQVKALNSASALWWCHAETILNKYDIARVKALKTGARLQFHRFDGNGSMGIRFSKEMLLDAQFNTQKSTSFIAIRRATQQECGRKSASNNKRQILHISMRAGNKDQTLNFLVTMHAGAELLTDTPLKTVTIKREMQSGQPTWHMIFMFVDEQEPPNCNDLPRNAVGLDFGFRKTKDGIRVASIHNGENVRFIELPDSWIARIEYAEKLQAQADSLANEIWEKLTQLVACLPIEGEESPFISLFNRASRTKKAYPDLMIRLVALQQQHPILDANSCTWLTQQAQLLRRYSEEAAGVKRRAIDHRKHLYRNVAATIVREAGLIGIIDTDFAKLAQLDNHKGEETTLHQLARRNRVLASPSELRLAIEQAAMKRGNIVKRIPAKHMTATCSACGHVQKQSISDLFFTCEQCDRLWDVDENSTINIRNETLKS